MTAYGRNEANAIFMAGDAAFTLVDSTHFGEFNDPKRSKIVGKIGMAPFPVGPRAQGADLLERDLGLGDSEGRAGGAQEARQGDALRDDDRRGRADRDVEQDRRSAAQCQALAEARRRRQGLSRRSSMRCSTQTPITHSAYYFAEWPAVHKAYSDMAIAALSGKREDIPKVLAEHVERSGAPRPATTTPPSCRGRDGSEDMAAPGHGVSRRTRITRWRLAR